MKLVKLLLVSLIALSPQAFATDDAEDHLLQYVEKISSYQCTFVQTIDDPDGQAVSKMQGKLSVLRPGKFLWKTTPPDPIVVVADGQHLWTYDIELEQVTKQDLKKALASSPAAILMGSAEQIIDDFKVVESQKGECASNDTDCFLLTPKQDEEMFKEITLVFSNDKLVRVSMEDPLGQFVVTTFNDIQVNVAMNQKLFEFTPPKDVDVIKPGH